MVLCYNNHNEGYFQSAIFYMLCFFILQHNVLIQNKKKLKKNVVIERLDHRATSNLTILNWTKNEIDMLYNLVSILWVLRLKYEKIVSKS